MKFLAILLSALLMPGVSHALTTANLFWTDYTTTKDCGSQGIYVGPNSAEKHGGYCLFYVGGPFKMHSSYSTSKVCNNNGTYAGVNRADLHGGTCLWNADYELISVYSTSKSCRSFNDVGVYVGPNKPSSHGGSCLYIRQ